MSLCRRCRLGTRCRGADAAGTDLQGVQVSLANRDEAPANLLVTASGDSGAECVCGEVRPQSLKADCGVIDKIFA